MGITLIEFSNELWSYPWMTDFLYDIYMDAAENRYAWNIEDSDTVICFDDDYEYTDLIEIYGDAAMSSGKWGWVNKRGEVIYVSFASHDITPLIFFGQTVGEFEQEWARVTEQTLRFESSLKYVKNQTKIQERVVLDMIDNARK